LLKEIGMVILTDFSSYQMHVFLAGKDDFSYNRAVISKAGSRKLSNIILGKASITLHHFRCQKIFVLV